MIHLIRSTLACSIAGGILAIAITHVPSSSMAQSISEDIELTYPAAGAPVQATVNVNKASIDFDFNLNADFAVVRISGPDFYTLSKRINNSDHISVDLLEDLDFSSLVDSEVEKQTLADAAYLPDGRYTFEIMVHSTEGARHTTRGSFEVYAGSAFLLPSRTTIPSSDEGVSDIREPGLMQQLAGSILEFFIPSAHAQSSFVDDFLTINDAAADNDTGVNLLQNGSFTEFGMRNVEGVFKLKDSAGPLQPGDTVFLNIVGSTGKVGFGTENPATTLHLVTPNAFAGFRLDDSRGSWTISTGGFSEDLGFRIVDTTTSTTPFRIDRAAPNNSIRVAANGNVGIGTGAPNANFHLNSATSANFLIESGASEQGGFSFLQGGSARWVFRTRADSSNFEIARRNPDGTPNDRPMILSYGTGNLIVENRLELRDASEPGAPPAGGTVYVDSVSGDLKVRFANGTIRTIANN